MDEKLNEIWDIAHKERQLETFNTGVLSTLTELDEISTLGQMADLVGAEFPEEAVSKFFPSLKKFAGQVQTKLASAQIEDRISSVYRKDHKPVLALPTSALFMINKIEMTESSPAGMKDIVSAYDQHKDQIKQDLAASQAKLALLDKMGL